ncbi:hypothetical protein [Pseudoduganella armeniaca]|uniref:Uncharacterized protein n=1 Tax=Pseudoduganella armeniaca TaxID=2072590 RepID=A0A2R4C5L3_9BURK|nr:hypothetical protein [Pseudoduganella armeniaca]AVR94893.1 hypothetical protein C9I28_03570 [Pseudoduganella armeniaca]
MKSRTRKRLALYGAELLLVAMLMAALAAWPGVKPLELSIGALLLHLTTGVGMWLFDWRFAGLPEQDRLFGVRMVSLLKGSIAVGVLLMLSWVVVPSAAVWVTGVMMVVLAVEELVTSNRSPSPGNP